MNRAALTGCDTLMALSRATKSGQTLFAKNSDRPKDECQPLVWQERRNHAPGATVRCRYIEAPQAVTTFRHAGSKPYWCWGYEHGFNEHQVVIGNEALHSKFLPSAEQKLIGMELVRLGLERGRSAAQAVDVMTSLITTFGQGEFKNDDGIKTYDNGYIVADPREAYVIESAGHEWAVKSVSRHTSISNLYSVQADWDRASPLAEHRAGQMGWRQDVNGRFSFGATFGPADEPSTAAARRRRARSGALLERHAGDIDAAVMFAILRDHASGDKPTGPFQTEPTGGISICMHHAEGIASNTAASLVADLCADGTRLPVYWCSFYSPCSGVFLPLFLEGRIPAGLSAGGEVCDSESPWWLFRSLEERLCEDAGAVGARQAVRKRWQATESDFLQSAYAAAERAKNMIDAGRNGPAADMLTDYMERNVAGVLASVPAEAG